MYQVQLNEKKKHDKTYMIYPYVYTSITYLHVYISNFCWDFIAL